MTVKPTGIFIDLDGENPGQVRITQAEVLTREDGTEAARIPGPTLVADFDSPHVKAALGDSHAEMAKQLDLARAATADADKAKAEAEAAAAAAQANLDEAQARADGLEKERDQAVATIEEVHARENDALIKAKEAEAALVAEQAAHAETKAAIAATEPAKQE